MKKRCRFLILYGVIALLVALAWVGWPERDEVIELRDARDGHRLEEPSGLFRMYVDRPVPQDLTFVPKFLRCHLERADLRASNGLLHLPRRYARKLAGNAAELIVCHRGYEPFTVEKFGELRRGKDGVLVVPMVRDADRPPRLPE